MQPSAELPDTRLLEHPAPVAFCIPGARPLLVLSSGMVAELDEAQLAAVVAHERAHLREHHHLLLLPFVAWEAALPVLPAAARAHAAVRDLVEMRADDVALGSLAAARRTPRRTLAQAIVAAAEGAGGAGVPGGALAVAGGASVPGWCGCSSRRAAAGGRAVRGTGRRRPAAAPADRPAAATRGLSPGRRRRP